jgi:glycosyltransferase involved in cell wall biosynthesis
LTKHRVLHFLWTGDVGGAERAVYQVVREEVRLGEWDVGVAFGQARGPYAEALRSIGAEVLDLQMSSTADLPRALRGVDRMREFDIHHFHVLEPSQMIASTRCDQAVRVFTQRHGRHTVSEPARKRLRRSLGGALLRRYALAVSGNTQHATDYAAARYRLGDIPTLVTYNGIDFSLLKPERDREELRSALGIGPGEIVVGSSGTFKSWKRFGRLVDLLPALSDVHVLLVGDGRLRGDLEALAQALGAGDRLHVTGLTGAVADYLQAMDVFVLPSTADESFGNSVVEAMALGLPSIVFADSPGICEHIENDVTGFIVDDPGELADTVGHLRDDPVTRIRVGHAGERYVRSKYTLERMHDSYRRLYEAALAERDRR